MQTNEEIARHAVLEGMSVRVAQRHRHLLLDLAPGVNVNRAEAVDELGEVVLDETENPAVEFSYLRNTFIITNTFISTSTFRPSPTSQHQS